MIPQCRRFIRCLGRQCRPWQLGSGSRLLGINDMIAGFLHNVGTVPEGVLWRTYAMLEVYIPPDEYILALKLLANRPKDQEDIQALCQQLHVQTREQAQQIIDHYVPEKEVQQLSGLDKTFRILFP